MHRKIIKPFLPDSRIFAVVLFVGLAFRISALFSRDFWFDEAFTYFIARLPIYKLIPAIATDNNPPLYYLLIHFILKISISDWVLRLPSLIFNLGTIWLMAAFFKSPGKRITGLIAAGLFSASPLGIYLATTARLHALGVFLLMLAVWLINRIQQKIYAKFYYLLLATFLAGIYTQYYFILLIIPLLVVFFRLKINPKIILTGLVMIVLACLPWIRIISQTSHNKCLCPQSLLSVPAALAVPAINGLGEVSLSRFPELPFYLWLIFGLTSLILIYFFIKGLKTNIILTVFFLIPFLLLSVTGLFLPVFSLKGFAIFSPLFFLLVATGITSSKYQRYISLLLIILLSVISLIQLTDPFFKGTEIKPLLPILKKNPDIAIFHMSAITYYPVSYYLASKQANYLLTDNPFSSETVKYIGGQHVNQDITYDIFWQIDANNWVNSQDRQKILSGFKNNFFIEEKYQFNGGSLNLWKKKLN